MQVVKQDWKIGDCRGQEISIHYPSGAEFCYNCNHYTLVDFMRKCQCCKLRVTRRRTFIAEITVFDRIVEQNKEIIEFYQKHNYHSDNMPGFAVKIGYRTYLVSIAKLAEYYSMPVTRNPDKVAPFFNRVKNECLQLMPATSVR